MSEDLTTHTYTLEPDHLSEKLREREKKKEKKEKSKKKKKKKK